MKLLKFNNITLSLGDPRDVAWLEGQIESKYIIDNIFYDDYNHMDFVWGMSAPRMIYDGLISLLKKQMGINYWIFT